jgi:hypothetical protein
VKESACSCSPCREPTYGVRRVIGRSSGRNQRVTIDASSEVDDQLPMPVEFWTVATRPHDDNGLGLTTTQAANELTAVQDFFRLLLYTPEVTDAWKRIVATQGVSGRILGVCPATTASNSRTAVQNSLI